LVTLGATKNMFLFEILNSLNPYLQFIDSIIVITYKDNFIETNSKKIVFKEMSSNFRGFLEDIDIVLCPASTSAFENIARGFPTGIFQLFNNQAQNYSFLSKHDLALPLGFVNKNGVLEINQKLLNQLIVDGESRRTLSANVLGLIDDLGPTRVVNEILMKIDVSI
jgi:spore coat polysaccharide biosynthesis predicted glycosyltransferase SpsG